MNLVLSFGDLARSGGYRTRVMGELHTLDSQDDLDPFLLVFDRHPDEFEKSFKSDLPHQAVPRSTPLQFYRVISRLARRQRIRVVHAHNLYSAALALSARWRYGYKVVLDYHGRIPEEYVYLGKGGSGSRKALEMLERWCVTSADHVVVVSQQLADYVMGRYRLTEDRFSVIPCCTDASKFRWDPERRHAVRASMQLLDKFVCVHLGSFVEWYDTEAIVDVFNRIRAHTESHLLVITGDAERAISFLSSRLPKGSFSVRSAAHDEVPGLLNASDLGLLLLRPSPNIKTSSPVKYAEYLNSGLPVLISPDVGDFSKMTVQENVGAVMDRRWLDTALIESIRQNRDEAALRCVEAGRALTWQSMAPAWTTIIRTL